MSATKNMVIDHLNNQREKKANYKQGWKQTNPDKYAEYINNAFPGAFSFVDNGKVYTF